jgi:hypothetical protein
MRCKRVRLGRAAKARYNGALMVSPPINPELIAAANCAGAFLMLVAFVLLVVSAVALHFAWRGLKSGRGNMPEAMSLLAGYIRQLQQGTSSTTRAMVGPQVTVASRWAGLKAGLRTLVTGGSPPPADSTPPDA